jgi:hypothetical protein
MSDSCTATNNRGSSVAILTPVQSTSPNLSQLGTVFQNMEVCKLASGKTSIANGATDNIVLDESYLDTNNQPQPALFYDLVACETTWYQPVANTSISNILGTGFGSVTLPQNTILTDTATFLQYISAYPGSKLTQDYTTATQSAQNSANAAVSASGSSSSSSSADPTAAMTAFFAGTQSFKDVTVDAVSTMQAYYNNFPCVWAEYKQNVTYYLYAAGSGGANTDFIGTITLMLPAGKLDLTKPNAGYTCTFTPANNPSDLSSASVNSSKALNLIYANGQFNEQNAGDVPQVAVSGIFQLKSKFTQNPNDNTIITVLTGTINSQTVFGCDTNQKTQAPADQLFNFSTPAAAFNSVLEIAGALQFLFFLGETVKGAVTWFKNRGKLSTEALLNKQNELLDEKLKKLQTEQTAELKKFTATEQTKINKALKNLSNNKVTDPPKGAQLKAVDDNLNAASKVKQLQQVNDANADQIKVAAENASGMSSKQIQSMEQTAEKIKATNDELAKPPSDLPKFVDQVKPQVDSTVAATKAFVTEVGGQLEASAKESVAQSAKVATQLTENMEKVQEGTDALSEGGEPDKTPTVEPEFEDVHF